MSRRPTSCNEWCYFILPADKFSFPNGIVNLALILTLILAADDV
nr:MAG TPA_asm: hypothetical protein [Caudoviricetes sp.]